MNLVGGKVITGTAVLGGRKEQREARQIKPGSAVQGSSCPQILTGGSEPRGQGVTIIWNEQGKQ